MNNFSIWNYKVYVFLFHAKSSIDVWNMVNKHTLCIGYIFTVTLLWYKSTVNTRIKSFLRKCSIKSVLLNLEQFLGGISSDEWVDISAT